MRNATRAKVLRAAQELLYELREAGIRVPQDISVTGFDNIKLAEISHPALTTLHIPRERVGHLMSRALTGGDEIKTNKFRD